MYIQVEKNNDVYEVAPNVTPSGRAEHLYAWGEGNMPYYTLNETPLVGDLVVAQTYRGYELTVESVSEVGDGYIKITNAGDDPTLRYPEMDL